MNRCLEAQQMGKCISAGIRGSPVCIYATQIYGFFEKNTGSRFFCTLETVFRLTAPRNKSNYWILNALLACVPG
jgi:hypothetical protein